MSPTVSHLHPLQVENCDSNSRLVVDEDHNGKLRLERVKTQIVDKSLIVKNVFVTINPSKCKIMQTIIIKTIAFIKSSLQPLNRAIKFNDPVWKS